MIAHINLDDRLSILRVGDPSRSWNSLDDQRVCVLCGRKFKGRQVDILCSSRRRHTMSVSAFLLNRSSDLDINNTIDHRPEGDEKWFLENEKTVTQFCRKLAAERPLKDIRDEYNYPKKKGIKDECSRLLEASTMKSRRGFAIQRLMN